MITAYFFGSSIRMPPIFTNSASTPSTFIELILSTKAGGKVFSIPNKIPIFLVLTKVSIPNFHPEPGLLIAPKRNRPPQSKDPCNLHSLRPAEGIVSDSHRPRRDIILNPTSRKASRTHAREGRGGERSRLDPPTGAASA